MLDNSFLTFKKITFPPKDVQVEVLADRQSNFEVASLKNMNDNETYCKVYVL